VINPKKERAMTAITNLPAPIQTQAAIPAPISNAPKATPQVARDNDGDTDNGAHDNAAVKLSLSPAAKNIVSNPPAPAAALIDPNASIVAASKRKVAAEVGVAGASEVVDKQGNISAVKLAQLLSLQK
jgi:hypothetical protein